MRLMSAALAITALLTTGCAMTKYERTVTVHRDANGNVTSIDEVEHMLQSGSKKKMPTWYMYDKGNAVK